MLKATLISLFILNLFAFGQYQGYQTYEQYAGYDTVAAGDSYVFMDTTGWKVKQWLHLYDEFANGDTTTTTITDRSLNGNDGLIVNKANTNYSASGLYLGGTNGYFVDRTSGTGSYVTGNDSAAMLIVFKSDVWAARVALVDNRQFFLDLNDSSPPDAPKWRWRRDVYRGGWAGAAQSTNQANTGWFFAVIDVNVSANRIWIWDSTGTNTFSNSTADTGNLTQAAVSDGHVGTYWDATFPFAGYIYSYMVISTSQDSATYKAQWDLIRDQLP